MAKCTITDTEARHVLEAHIAYEQAGGERDVEWYAGVGGKNLGGHSLEETKDWVP